MSQLEIYDKAENIRDVLRYIKKFKNATIIIHIDDELLDNPIFSSHIKDICLIHESGMNVIIVPGARKKINQVLRDSNITWKFVNGNRVTNEDAIPLIKNAAFDVSNQIMTALAGQNKTALIGNWVTARGIGVIDGIDYSSSGTIDHLQEASIRTILENNFIPIFPCIGWSSTGKPYNISSMELAKQIAIQLKADKLFFVTTNVELKNQEGTIPAMNLEELVEFISATEQTDGKNLNYQTVDSLKNTPGCFTNEYSLTKIKPIEQSVNLKNSLKFSSFTTERSVNLKEIIKLLTIAKECCENGVNRVHILNGSINGTLLCEIYSNLGSGTMIYKNNYGEFRSMTIEDIPSVLTLIQPFVDSGLLLPKTKQYLQQNCEDFTIYELDGAIRACASLHQYQDGQMEIGCVAVNEICSNIGVGPQLIGKLIKKAKESNASGLFLLTTRTMDFFEKLGFTNDSIDSIPAERKALWSPERNSKVMRYYL